MLVATVFDLDETLVDSAATWNHVIGAVAGRHGYSWTSDDWASIQGTSTNNWSAYLVHRCLDLTPERCRRMCWRHDVADGKPAPDPYLLAAHCLGVDPAQCLAVEDSGSGIRSAHAAGMTVLAIPNATTALDFDVLKFADHHAADAFIAAKVIRAASWCSRRSTS